MVVLFCVDLQFSKLTFPISCHGLKEIDSIWVILKEFKSWGEKKEERKLDTLRKRYVRATNTNTLAKPFRFPQQQTHDHAHDPRTFSWNCQYNAALES